MIYQAHSLSISAMTSGVILFPLICLIMTIGNSAIICGLWPIHCIWTYYCVVRYLSWLQSLKFDFLIVLDLLSFLVLIFLTHRSEKLGPALKFVACTCLLPLVLMLWPLVGIVGSVIGGAAYGFFAPIFATFEAVEGGKEYKLFHCFIVCFIFDVIKILVNFVLLLSLNTEFHIASSGWNMDYYYKDL